MVYKNFSKYDIDVDNLVVYSNHYNKKRNLILSETADGYIRCGVTDDKGNRYYRLHQVIYCAVNGITKDEWPVDENGYKYEIDHIDNNKKNNHPSNLKLVSKKQQMNNPITRKTLSKILTDRMSIAEERNKISDSLKNRSDESKNVYQYTLNGEFIAEFPSIMEASRKTGLYFTGISQCCNGWIKKFKGYIWKFNLT